MRNGSRGKRRPVTVSPCFESFQLLFQILRIPPEVDF